MTERTIHTPVGQVITVTMPRRITGWVATPDGAYGGLTIREGSTSLIALVTLENIDGLVNALIEARDKARQLTQPHGYGQPLAHGHFDGDGCTFPTTGHFQ